MPTLPWKKPTPKAGAKTKLTPASIAWARAKAKKQGRRYPNLVDNLAATRRQLEAEHRRDNPGPEIIRGRFQHSAAALESKTFRAPKARQDRGQRQPDQACFLTRGRPPCR